MTPMRVAATAIEAYRLWRDPEQEWMTEQALQDQILRRPFAPSPAMQRGTAFGKVVEAPDLYRVPSGFVCMGYYFSADMMAPVLASFDHRGLFEVKGSKLYGDVLVVSKADQMLGGQIVETKTTERFDFEKYAASAQWRLMADAFEPLLITYRVYTVADDLGPEPGLTAVEVRESNEFNLFPYPALHADCEALVDEFRAYVLSRGMDHELRAIQARLEAAA